MEFGIIKHVRIVLFTGDENVVPTHLAPHFKELYAFLSAEPWCDVRFARLLNPAMNAYVPGNSIATHSNRKHSDTSNSYPNTLLLPQLCAYA
jgi:hypothetical protein